MRRLCVLACAFSCCPPGKPGFSGGEDVLGWNILKQIARFHEVWALTYAENRLSIEDALGEEPVPNIHFHYVDGPFGLRPLLRYQGGHQLYYHLWQIKAYFAARRLHKRCHFDLFHHITYANDWMASFIGALLPVPYVRGPGGGAQRIPKGLIAHSPLRGRLSEGLRGVGQWLFRHDPFFVAGQSRARVLLVCNREALDAVPARWRQKCQLFPVNGVSTGDLETGSSMPRLGKGFRVLTAGKLLWLKGFGLALEAFKEFGARHPEAQLTIVGDGPELSRLSELAKASGQETQVRFRKWMAREELLAEMASCDVFLFPSLRDGGGAVVVEAMALGRPVVCLDTAGPGIHVTEGSGIKVPPRSPEQTVHDLAKALERLCLDEGLRLKLGKAARDRAEQVYHWDRLGERLMGIYQHALSAG